MTIPAHHNAVLVTGGTGGLGSVICSRLLAEGFRVAMSDVDVSTLDAAAQRLANPELMFCKLDVTKPSDFERVLDQISERWGGIGVLVNNAALTDRKSVV